ncbi:hypothetical protein B566_EDAN014310 [Ephemera danica]|nr:hypothetical protein B566_EDAN014310 [Ephemera danica]
MKFKSSDVSFIEQEIADGLDVNCGAHYVVDLDEEKNWEETLSLPYPLMHTMNCKLQYYSHSSGHLHAIFIGVSESEGKGPSSHFHHHWTSGSRCGGRHSTLPAKNYRCYQNFIAF